MAEAPSFDVNTPTSARAYGWLLGGKDNFASDRAFMLKTLESFPECVDIGRQNRLFLYRAVRFLSEEAGINQFLDLGCGLPTERNVHEVAQTFNPDARVVYVDIDPVVLVHARALLAGSGTTAVITADMREPESILADPKVTSLIDFSQPVAVLYLSVAHHLYDADDPRRTLRTIIDTATVPGSYLAMSQIVADEPKRAAELSKVISAQGIPWQTRVPSEVDGFLDGLEPVEPGLGNLINWRPDPTQPELADVPDELKSFDGYTTDRGDVYEYGGILRKP
jgi:S-adenosyl methyltransferase